MAKFLQEYALVHAPPAARAKGDLGRERNKDSERSVYQLPRKKCLHCFNYLLCSTVIGLYGEIRRSEVADDVNVVVWGCSGDREVTSDVNVKALTYAPHLQVISLFVAAFQLVLGCYLLAALLEYDKWVSRPALLSRWQLD